MFSLSVLQRRFLLEFRCMIVDLEDPYTDKRTPNGIRKCQEMRISFGEIGLKQERYLACLVIVHDRSGLGRVKEKL